LLLKLATLQVIPLTHDATSVGAERESVAGNKSDAAFRTPEALDVVHDVVAYFHDVMSGRD
jgi:hypothetical protein